MPAHADSYIADFIRALHDFADDYAIALDDAATHDLSVYAGIVRQWNPRLHLVAPCSPVEFATRHVLESLLAVKHLPAAAHVTDVGSGAGLPLIPCLIARDDLTATLVEANAKKSIFLREAISAVRRLNRAQIINDRFERTHAPTATDFISCRALERFSELLPDLLAWSPARCTFLLFGGTTLRDAIDEREFVVDTELIPHSTRRFLFIVRRRTNDEA